MVPKPASRLSCLTFTNDVTFYIYPYPFKHCWFLMIIIEIYWWWLHAKQTQVTIWWFLIFLANIQDSQHSGLNITTLRMFWQFPKTNYILIFHNFGVGLVLSLKTLASNFLTWKHVSTKKVLESVLKIFCADTNLRISINKIWYQKSLRICLVQILALVAHWLKCCLYETMQPMPGCWACFLPEFLAVPNTTPGD